MPLRRSARIRRQRQEAAAASAVQEAVAALTPHPNLSPELLLRLIVQAYNFFSAVLAAEQRNNNRSNRNGNGPDTPGYREHLNNFALGIEARLSLLNFRNRVPMRNERMLLMANFVCIALTRSSTLPALILRNHSQGLRKLLKIIRYLFLKC